MSTELTIESIEEAIRQLKKEDQNHCVRLEPKELIIPDDVRQYLYEQGYETEEQIVELVNKLTNRMLRRKK